MNNYKFNDVNVGLKVEFKFNISPKKMADFLSITGDENPLHCNNKYAMTKGYEEPVVYGMLTASVLSTLAGMYLPGKYSLIHEVEVKFLKPVFISKTPLKIKAEIVEKDKRFSIIILKYAIFDIENTKVCKGFMKIGFLE